MNCFDAGACVGPCCGVEDYALELYARILMDRITHGRGHIEVDGDCVSVLRQPQRRVTGIIVAWRVLMIVWTIKLAKKLGDAVAHEAQYEQYADAATA